jgi:hypothetical protein
MMVIGLKIIDFCVGWITFFFFFLVSLVDLQVLNYAQINNINVKYALK